MPRINPQQLPYQVTTDKVGGANSRAVQQVLMSQPRFATTSFEGFYTEPLVLNVGAEQPESIELTRITNKLAPDSPVTCGSMVHWSFRPDLGGAQILSIDGLSPLSGITYRFTFRITYKAQV